MSCVMYRRLVLAACVAVGRRCFSVEATSRTFVPSVILVQSSLPENIGATARAMKNCGLSELRLVAPACEWNGVKSYAVAVGASALLDNAKVYDTVPNAVADLHSVFATTGKLRAEMQSYIRRPFLDVKSAAAEVVAKAGRGLRCGLLFGPERTGLHNNDLDLADSLVSIPLNPDFPSLNLAQAVMIVCYEWMNAAAAGSMPDVPSWAIRDSPVATRADIQALLERCAAMLPAAEPRDKRELLLKRLHMLLLRLEPVRSEVMLLHALVTQLCGTTEWSRQQGKDGKAAIQPGSNKTHMMNSLT